MTKYGKKKNKKKLYIRLGFILERCLVQMVRRIEEEDGSLSGSTHRGTVECVLGNELTAIRPTHHLTAGLHFRLAPTM